jgi:hypothetical protein
VYGIGNGLNPGGSRSFLRQGARAHEGRRARGVGAGGVALGGGGRPISARGTACLLWNKPAGHANTAAGATVLGHVAPLLRIRDGGLMRSDSFAILIVERGRARICRFNVELRGETLWATDTAGVASRMAGARPELVAVAGDVETAMTLAEVSRNPCSSSRRRATTSQRRPARSR